MTSDAPAGLEEGTVKAFRAFAREIGGRAEPATPDAPGMNAALVISCISPAVPQGEVWVVGPPVRRHGPPQVVPVLNVGEEWTAEHRD